MKESKYMSFKMKTELLRTISYSYIPIPPQKTSILFHFLPSCSLCRLPTKLRRRTHPPRPRAMASLLHPSPAMRSLLLALLALLASPARAGYAPRDAPDLPEGWCPPETGAATATTGGERDARSLDRSVPRASRPPDETPRSLPLTR